MNHRTFLMLETHVKDFKYTSFQYIDYNDIKDYEVIYNDEDGILIKGYDEQASMHKVIYACDHLDTFIKLISDHHEALVQFIPSAWHQRLLDLKFTEYAIMRDYWIHDITSFHQTYDDIKLATLEDLDDIFYVLEDNKAVSRAFLGESKAFIENWILGNDELLSNMQATDYAIYLYKMNHQTVGVAFTCIYAHDHPKGAVLWLRELAVKKDHHGMGIGRKLILHALSRGQKLGAKRSFLATDELNLNAKHLYVSIGYEPNQADVQIDMLTPNHR